jgi:hypothetical protein
MIMRLSAMPLQNLLLFAFFVSLYYLDVIKEVTRGKVVVFTTSLDIAQTETKGTVLIKDERSHVVRLRVTSALAVGLRLYVGPLALTGVAVFLSNVNDTKRYPSFYLRIFFLGYHIANSTVHSLPHLNRDGTSKDYLERALRCSTG